MHCICACPRKKLDKRSTKCVLLGVSEVSKAYRLFDPITHKIIISKDVIFDEADKWNWRKIDEPRKLIDMGERGEEKASDEEHNRTEESIAVGSSSSSR